LIFAIIALLVGAFMIFNTFSITVAQRTRENGLLRALGASKRQVLGSVLLEAVVVGIIASLIGLAAGVAVAIGLKAMLSGLGVGALLVFFGVSVLGRTVSLPLSRAVGAPLPRLRGVTGKLARQNAMRNPKRTAASASALMIGVGLVGFITILAASSTASVNSA